MNLSDVLIKLLSGNAKKIVYCIILKTLSPFCGEICQNLDVFAQTFPARRTLSLRCFSKKCEHVCFVRI